MNTPVPSVLIGSPLFVAGNEDMLESLNEFEFRPDSTTDHYRVSCHIASEKSMYNVVNILAPSFLIGSSSLLHKISDEF